MKTFERIKVINGKEYAYQITPYYDKKTKLIRHKSKYIGKMQNGNVIRPRKPLPRRVFAYGEFIPLLRVFNEIGIEEILSELCRDSDAQIIKMLACNRVLRPLALQNVGSWAEGTILAKESKLHLSPKTLTSFMQRLGESSIPAHFVEKFSGKHQHIDSLVYDITSLSSYSQLNNLLEYGYSRDGDDLPQFNLSLAVDRKMGIPLMYDIYPGSISDVSTMHNSIKKIKSMGLDFSALVLDRGFFSANNISELVSQKIDFIIGAPFQLKEVKGAISKTHASIEEARHMHLYEKKPIFVTDVTVNVGEMKLDGFIYYDMKREQEEKTHLYTRLHETIQQLEGITLQSWMNPQSVFEETAKDLRQYLSYSIKENRFTIEAKQNAIAQRVNRMGRMVLLHSGDFSWQECLSVYRQKDIVEKNFRALKTSILQSPLHAQKAECVRGWIFILYLALMIHFRLMYMMRESGLLEKYSVEMLFIELEKLKKVELENGELITAEVTKKQRVILEALGLCA